MKLKITIAIMVYFVLLIILVLNMDEKSKVIKNSFLMFMISLFAALFVINELVMDYIVSSIIRFIYFPSFTSIVVALILTMIIFINSVYDDEMKDKTRIINYIFSSFIYISFIVFMFLNIDINSYNALYEGDSLLSLRYISRTFGVWIIISILIKYFHYFGKRQTNK